MTNRVDCPNCDEAFDAVEDTGRRIACHHCRSTWGQLHAMVDPDYTEPEDVKVDYPFDGPGGVAS